MAVEVISVHVPKAGGSSLRQSLVDAFGGDAVHFDYGDDPVDPCCSFNLDPEGCKAATRAAGLPPQIKVIHGHLPVGKYDHLEAVKRIAILRPPIENLLSIHYYWKTVKDGHCLFRYCRDANLSAVDLARVPALRYLYSKRYFPDGVLDRFDLVGTTEFYPGFVSRLSALLGVELTESRVNVTSFPSYKEEAGNLLADRQSMDKMRDLLMDDLRLYERFAAKWG